MAACLMKLLWANHSTQPVVLLQVTICLKPWTVICLVIIPVSDGTVGASTQESATHLSFTIWVRLQTEQLVCYFDCRVFTYYKLEYSIIYIFVTFAILKAAVIWVFMGLPPGIQKSGLVGTSVELFTWFCLLLSTQEAGDLCHSWELDQHRYHCVLS